MFEKLTLCLEFVLRINCVNMVSQLAYVLGFICSLPLIEQQKLNTHI